MLLHGCKMLIGPILWGHSGPLCHALSSSSLLLWTSILHCHSPGVATVARRLRYSYSWLRLILVVVSTVATPGEWQCKIRTGGVRRLAVANWPNIFQMLLVIKSANVLISRELASRNRKTVVEICSTWVLCFVDVLTIIHSIHFSRTRCS